MVSFYRPRKPDTSRFGMADGGGMSATTPIIRSRDQFTRVSRMPHAEMHRLRKGMYVRADTWQSLTPWERYELRVDAFRTTNPGATLSHESAAVLHGLPLFGEARHLHSYVHADEMRTQKFADRLVHTSTDRRNAVLIDGTWCTDLIDTLIDIGRCLPPAAALACWDDALRRGVRASDIGDRWVRMASGRGTRTLRWLTAFADAAAESPAESVSRAAISWLGYPAPVLQREFRTQAGTDRVDFCWPDERLVGEADGLAKYGLNQDPLTALRDEKAREGRLRVAGFTVCRWMFEDLTSPSRLDALLRGAGLRPPRAKR